MIKKYLLYMGRWQLSTPILAIIPWAIASIFDVTIEGKMFWIAAAASNLIGSLIFFWVDRFIFRSTSKTPLWEIIDSIKCIDCGTVGRCYRIVEWVGYNRRVVNRPEFRCEKCKDRKMLELIERLKLNYK